MKGGATGGYFRMDSWVLATIVQLGTREFCKHSLNRTNDPHGRQFDRMTAAARRGCAGNCAGAARASSGNATAHPVEAARASFAELEGDLLNWLLQNGKAPWPRSEPESRKIYGIRLDKPEYGEDLQHDACLHILAQKEKFAPWLESGDEEAMANCLLILISRVTSMLTRQREAQRNRRTGEDSSCEKLAAVRNAPKSQPDHDAPPCPECGQPMALRRARNGRNAGNEFWGCTGYPNCRGVREVEENGAAA